MIFKFGFSIKLSYGFAAENGDDCLNFKLDKLQYLLNID